MTRELRLIVFDLLNPGSIQPFLSERYSERITGPITSWNGFQPSPGATPFLFWPDTEERFIAQAPTLLRSVIYPLVASGSPYCVGFPFSSSFFQPREIDQYAPNDLDLEDIGNLLLSDAVTTTAGMLDQLDTRLVLTPIEEQLHEALRRAEINARPQIRLGRYVADFLIEHDGQRVVVEADGRGFHDTERDSKRDQELRAAGVAEVLRFTGSQIYGDADGCAARVADHLRRGLRASSPPSRRMPSAGPELDESQRLAAAHPDGPARLLAPAGSGKTLTMVQRIHRLVDSGVAPDRIAVLAFNKKAADQLEDRLAWYGVPTRRNIIPDGQHGVLCATFNAFGYRYQREIIGHRPQLETSQASFRTMLAQALPASGNLRIQQFKAARGSDPVGELLKALAKVRADLQPPESLEVEIESWDRGDNPIINFGPVHQEYARAQMERNVQSFDDQLYLAVRDMLAVPRHRQHVQRLFDYVMVDEYQDLNGSQLALIDILSRPHRNLFVVGDDDQLIYGWRFADVDTILQFHDRMPAEPLSQTYTLITNYRCSRAIVESSRRLIDHNLKRVRKDIRPKEGAIQGAVRFMPSEQWVERAQYIVEFLKSELARLDCGWRELAVLCRYKAQQPLVALALDRAGIPRTPLLTYRLFSDSTGLLLGSYIKLAHEPEQICGEDLAYVLNRPNRYLKNVDVEMIARSQNPWRDLQRLAEGGEQAARTAQYFIRRVEALHQRIEHRRFTSMDLLSEVVSEFELERFWANELGESATKEQDEANPRQILEVLRTVAADHPDVSDFVSEWEQAVERERQRFDMAADELVREESKDRDQVVIGTIHAAKGREYKSVVIVDYNPDLSRLTTSQQEEERRVLYVGVTRATEQVMLTIPKSGRQMHRYIRELIEPSKEGELNQIQVQLAELEQREIELLIACSILEEKIEAIRSGDVLGLVEATLDFEWAEQARFQRELADLRVEQNTGGLRRLWWQITGELGRITARIQQRQEELSATENRVKELREQQLVLRANPEQAARSHIEQLAKTRRQVAEGESTQTRKRERLELLELLSD